MRRATGCWNDVLLRNTISDHGTGCLNVRGNLRAFGGSETNRQGKRN